MSWTPRRLIVSDSAPLGAGTMEPEGRELMADRVSGERLEQIGVNSANTVDRIDQLLYTLLLDKPLPTDLGQINGDLKEVFGSAPDISVQPFRCRGGLDGLVVYEEMRVDQQLLVLGVLPRVVNADLTPEDGKSPEILVRISRTISPAGSISPSDRPTQAETLGKLAESVLGGSAVICLQGCQAALAFDIGNPDKRSITTPPSEPSVYGPHEGFIEDGDTNLSLIRRRIRTPRLRIEEFRLGTLTRTAVYLIYIHGLTDDLVVAEARRRIQRVEVDGVVESQTLMEYIQDAPRSPVPMMQRTERPDRVVAALLQGQFAVVTDGTPFALVAPVTIGRLIKSVEDYYQNWMASTLVRAVRLLAILVAAFLPAFYVAIVTYHPEFIPPQLLVTLAAARNHVPLPSLGEVLVLLGLFEIIREAGARVPNGIGSALTIGGTLVVGEAAVRAGIISAPIIIVTSAVVIAAFAVPNYDMVLFTRFLVYPLLLSAAFIGIFGLLFASFALAFYLASLRSFGVPFLSPAAPLQPQDWKDYLLRAPWWAMNTRPSGTGYTDVHRQPPGQKPHPPREEA